MNLPPKVQELLSKLQPLLETKQGRTKLAVAAIVILLLLTQLFSCSEKEPDVVFIPATPEAPVEPPGPPAPPNVTNSDIILDLFSPSAESLGGQLATTSLNQQIEQTLAVTFLLTKCLTISQDDYADVYRALVYYAQLAKLAPDEASADTKVREIAQSANASYGLIYSRVACTDPQLPKLAGEVKRWTDLIFRQQQ